MIIDFILNIDKHIEFIVTNYTTLTYFILFCIIFVETGVVVLPFLPGDSVLFAAGAIIASSGVMNPIILLILLYFAAIMGDSLNYTIGHILGKNIREKKKIKLIKMEYIDKTHDFFEKHGNKAITLARFVPIIRTFAPFIAGVGKMNYKVFLRYNIIGGILWVSSMFGLGFFFGNISFVKENFSLIIISIIFITILPIIIPFIKIKIKRKK